MAGCLLSAGVGTKRQLSAGSPSRRSGSDGRILDAAGAILHALRRDRAYHPPILIAVPGYSAGGYWRQTIAIPGEVSGAWATPLPPGPTAGEGAAAGLHA